ncbi:cyclin-F-like isoform X1 [Mytilus californianus]|uniref:cyclin-F-like isoform X1 n=1 Tax=Mytilus californianus TaxID=6549 RepID=UPI002247C216|nr:cyclin-F-like isoform X1 [Mytilus californianus]
MKSMFVKILLNALSKFQKSPNTFIPVHMHLRPRTRSQMTIWNLPEELLLYIIKGLHIRDVLNLRAVHPYFKDLIENSSVIWNSTSFQDEWPSLKNIPHFEKAGDLGNLEALIKMAIAYLYNEGLPTDLEGKKTINNGEKAADIFCRIEGLSPNTDPFTWLFIRPPWSVNGACCKECVFKYMKDFIKTTKDKNIHVCVARTLMLLESEDTTEICQYLKDGAELGSGVAAFMFWQQKYDKMVMDKGTELTSIRELRDLTSLGYLEAKLTLCKYYAHGKYGGISQHQAAMFVKDLVQTTSPTNTQDCFQTSQELTQSMRYILVDWLVEVAGMKDFSSHTLHVAVSMVDRFLKVHKTSRSKLQLLGVAAMLLCSRYLGKDIITIREAAWLTDSTYKYEDIVRMMGEIAATLKGNIRTITSIDLVEIFCILCDLDKKSCYLAEYICELCLLQAEMGQYSPAEIAASCVLLARVLMKHENAWPSKMSLFTGYKIEDISRCAFHLHEKCFLEGSVVDHRDVKLQSVKLRYAEEKFYKVSEIQIMSYEELCIMLGVTEHILQGCDVRVKFKNDDELILSPSRKKRKYDKPYSRMRERRTFNSLTMEGVRPHDSVLSGYDGDKEDADESFIEEEEFSDCSKLDEGFDASSCSEGESVIQPTSASKNVKTMTLNISFMNTSPLASGFSLVTPGYSCDKELTSGLASSPMSSTPEDCPSTSSVIPKSSSLCKLEHLPSMCADSTSDSDFEFSPTKYSDKRKSATSHMTLRGSRKRRQGGSCCALVLHHNLRQHNQ